MCEPYLGRVSLQNAAALKLGQFFLWKNKVLNFGVENWNETGDFKQFFSQLLYIYGIRPVALSDRIAGIEIAAHYMDVYWII